MPKPSAMPADALFDAITWVRQTGVVALDAFADKLKMRENLAATVARQNNLRVDTNKAGHRFVRTMAEAERNPF